MDAKKLSKKTRLGRVELDLTQSRLAEKINAKQKSISRYETAASLPSIRTLVKIVMVLRNQQVIFWMNKVKTGVSR